MNSVPAVFMEAVTVAPRQNLRGWQKQQKHEGRTKQALKPYNHEGAEAPLGIGERVVFNRDLSSLYCLRIQYVSPVPDVLPGLK
jgi:hypothetical protein